MDEHGPWVDYDMAKWFNIAARFQYLAAGGFSFRAFLGVTRLLNYTEGTCGEGSISEPCTSPRGLLYGGLAFGTAFEASDFP